MKLPQDEFDKELKRTQNIDKKINILRPIMQIINPTSFHNLENITEYLTTTYNIPPDNIVLSAIGLGEDNYWRWIVPPRIEGCANMSCILKNSAFLIRDNDIPYYYCNDKNQAIQNGKYFPDQRDIVDGCKGSYILWEIGDTAEIFEDIAHNIPLSHKVIVSISTYDVKLVDDEDNLNLCNKEHIHCILRAM